MNTLEAIWLFTFSSTAASFSFADFPAYLMSWTKAFPSGRAGRSGHIVSRTSKSLLSAIPWALSSISRSSLAAMEYTMPLIPVTSPGRRLEVSHWAIEGVSGRPSFIRHISVSASWSVAWRKYRESVHRRALSSVTTRSPAEPVNPLSMRRACQWAERYSLMCGSAWGIIAAETPAFFICSRNIDRRARMFSFI